VPLTAAGAILVAHSGMDRMAGYGLKLPTSFKDTHMGRIGRDRRPTTFKKGPDATSVRPLRVSAVEMPEVPCARSMRSR
jgi:hypothetical protein